MHQPWAVNQAWTRPEWGWWWQDAVAVYRAGDHGGFIADMVTGIMSDGGASVGLDQYGHTLAFDGGVGGIALNNPSLTQLTVPFTITVVGRAVITGHRAVVFATRQFVSPYTGFVLGSQGTGRFEAHYGTGLAAGSGRRSYYFWHDDFYGGDVAQAATLSITVGYFTGQFAAFGDGRRLSLGASSGAGSDTMVHHPEGTGQIGRAWVGSPGGLDGAISMISLHNGAWTEAQHRAWHADPFGALRMRALPVPPHIINEAINLALTGAFDFTEQAQFSEQLALAVQGGLDTAGFTAAEEAIALSALSSADVIARGDFRVDVSLAVQAALSVAGTLTIEEQISIGTQIGLGVIGALAVTAPASNTMVIEPIGLTMRVSRVGKTIKLETDE